MGTSGFGGSGFGTSSFGSSGLGLRSVNAINAVGDEGTTTTGIGGDNGGGIGGGSTSRRSSTSGSTLSQRGGGAGSARTLDMSSEVSIVADAINNSLLVRASPKDYKKILDALKQLDIPPLQVLVEATIVEIILTGNLQYGVQWNFYGLATKDARSRIQLNNGSLTQEDDAIRGGFSWVVVSRPTQIRAVLDALAGESLVNVLSSPSVMVLDNQAAQIQVGQEVPVATSQQQGTSTTDRIVNQVQYKNVGVMLSVRPRVTPGGMVQMEIEQEVSNPGEPSGLGPQFLTRRITSTVAVRSNQAVVLGGLILDRRIGGKSGVPGLYDTPFLGFLFGQRSKSSERNELVVVLTPKVIGNDQDIEAVSKDFQRKLRGLEFKL
jgi:general secretion pathway protein D